MLERIQNGREEELKRGRSWAQAGPRWLLQNDENQLLHDLAISHELALNGLHPHLQV